MHGFDCMCVLIGCSGIRRLVPCVDSVWWLVRLICTGRYEAAWLAGTGADFSRLQTAALLLRVCTVNAVTVIECSKPVVIRDWHGSSRDDSEAQQCVG